MHIAIWNGLRGCHHEMYGYFLEYFTKREYPITSLTIFMQDPNANEGWLQLYTSLFASLTLVAKPIGDFLRLQHIYTHFILVTDDDKSFPEKNVDVTKLLCIDHFYKIRRDGQFFRMSTRPFANRPNDRWAIPCYESAVPSIARKLDLLKDQNNRVKVGCVGMGGLFNFQFLKSKISNFESLDIIMFLRNTVRGVDRRRMPGNVQLKLSASAPELLQALACCDYVLCLPAKVEAYTLQLMSGSIPLAFCVCSQLIMPKAMIEAYGFQSALAVEDVESLEKINKDALLAVYDERARLIERRNKAFDEFFNR